MQLNHLHLRVASVARAAEFYGRAFGLTEHVWHDDGDMVWFRCRDPDGHNIEVYWEP